jgi:hypothetical protein
MPRIWVIEANTVTVVEPSLACEACAVTGQIGLQLALCGAVGGVVVVKIAAADAMGWILGRRTEVEDGLDSGAPEDEADSGSKPDFT